jgi:hypothetical protein
MTQANGVGRVQKKPGELRGCDAAGRVAMRERLLLHVTRCRNVFDLGSAEVAATIPAAGECHRVVRCMLIEFYSRRSGHRGFNSTLVGDCVLTRRIGFGQASCDGGRSSLALTLFLLRGLLSLLSESDDAEPCKSAD